MDKIKTVKIKNPDGSVSEETYTISVDAKDIDMKNGKDLQDTIGNIDVDRDGSIAEQLGKYKNYDSDIETLYNDIDSLEAADTELENNIIDLQINKINKTDIVDNLESNKSDKTLSAKQGKILNEKNIDTNKKIDTHLTSLELNRIFRFLDKRNWSTDSDYDSTRSTATGVQGGVIVSNTRLVTTTWDGNNQLDNKNKIQEINLETGAVIREQEYNWGWANGLTYNPSKDLLYVCPRGRCYSNGNQNLKEIVVVKYSDFSVVNTITLNTLTPIQSVYYTENGELWAMGEGISHFYKINPENYSIIETINVNIPSLNLINDYYYQNFCIIDDLFYVLGSTPRGLYVYNKQGNLVKQYTMPIQADQLYTIGEYQWIQYRNDMLYIGDSMTVGTDTMMQLFQTDLKTGNIGLSRTGEGAYYNNSQLTVYVDASNTNTNPTGTSSNPFKTISEAGLVPQNDRGGMIILIANGTYGQAYLFNLHHPRLSAISSSPNITIAGGDFRYCDNMEIFDMNFVDTVKQEVTSTIQLTMCDLFLRRCSISHTKTDGYGIYVHNSSKLILDNETTFVTNNTYNVDIDQTSMFINQNKAISFRRNGYNGVVLGQKPTISMEDFSISYGELPNIYTNFTNEKISYNNYTYILIDYTFKQFKKQIKCPIKLNPACVTDSYIDNQGNSYFGKTYVYWNNTTKAISITANRLVTITNNNGTAVITNTALDGTQETDFNNPDYININNISFE